MHVCKALNNLQRNQTHSEHSQLALNFKQKIRPYTKPWRTLGKPAAFVAMANDVTLCARGIKLCHFYKYAF